MPDPTDIPQFELPSNALIDALLADPASIEKWSLAVKLRDQRDKGRASLKEHHESLNKALEEVARNDVDPRQLEHITEVVLRNERAATERLRPRLETFQEKLSKEGHRLDPEIREYFQENLEVAAGWLELYKALRTKLLALSAARKRGPENVLRARPVAEAIDHVALTREIVARFPKILAALAK
jgi:hypothetical protein